MLPYDELEQICADHCQANSHALYLLADHSGLPDLANKLRENGVRWINLFGDDKRPALTAASPLLFEIPAPNGRPAKRRLLEWLHESGKYSASLLLIASPLALEALAQGLSKRCDGILSDGEAIVVRYFDTRVFPQLLDAIISSEKRTWLGIASGWWFVNRAGVTVHISSEFLLHDSYQEPMKITDIQLSGMLQASEIDQISYLLESNVPDQYQQLNPVERYRLLEAKMASAKRSGLSALSDLALFCGLALLHGAEFDTQPNWRDILSRVETGEITLPQAAELVN